MLDFQELLGRIESSGASDLLLTVGAAPQFRVQGDLRPLAGDDALDVTDVDALVGQILRPYQKESFEETKSLDFSMGYEGQARYRIHLYKQRGSTAMAVRAIPFDVPSFEELGLPSVVQDFAALRHGLVLITGPAGTGKSTTLAAIIDHINRNRQAHIICIEDPIEYLHPHRLSTVDQREVPSDTPSFSDALRNVFRESPDVIMVGEMRDLETISLVLTLAETGHLILATLHTHEAIHAISRIVDSFPSEQQQQVYMQLSMVLEGVVTQQLVPVNEGNRRLLACEVMLPNNAIRNLIRERQLQQIYSVLQTGSSEGMTTMNESLRQIYELGFIDYETAMNRSPRPKDLMNLLRGSVAAVA